eukprot:scaffold17947_cov34-Isochrysis_galbana.AAC.1
MPAIPVGGTPEIPAGDPPEVPAPGAHEPQSRLAEQRARKALRKLEKQGRAAARRRAAEGGERMENETA